LKCYLTALSVDYMRVLKLFLEEKKKYFSVNFPPVSYFQCEVSGRTYSCVRTRAAQMSGSARSCRVLTWQWSFGRVSYVSKRVPYRFKSASFLPYAAQAFYFPLFSLEFLRFSRAFSQVLSLFCPFLHIISFSGTLIYLLYSFQSILIVRILRLFWNIFVEINNA